MPRPALPVPEDFTVYALETIPQLMVRYGVSHGVIGRWRKRMAIDGRRSQPVPADFHIHAVYEGEKLLRRRYGVGAHTVQRWRRESGVEYVRPAPKPKAQPKAKAQRRGPERRFWLKIVRCERDESELGRAVDWLRRDAPVFRVNEAGEPCFTGKLWCRGRVMLTDAEVLERARARGWAGQ